jgi:hypothetical protein
VSVSYLGHSHEPQEIEGSNPTHPAWYLEARSHFIYQIGEISYISENVAHKQYYAQNKNRCSDLKENKAHNHPKTTPAPRPNESSFLMVVYTIRLNESSHQRSHESQATEVSAASSSGRGTPARTRHWFPSKHPTAWKSTSKDTTPLSNPRCTHDCKYQLQFNPTLKDSTIVLPLTV